MFFDYESFTDTLLLKQALNDMERNKRLNDLAREFQPKPDCLNCNYLHICKYYDKVGASASKNCNNFSVIRGGF